MKPLSDMDNLVISSWTLIKLDIDHEVGCNSVVKVCSWCDGLPDQFFPVDPLSYFSFQHVLHNCNCGIVHIEDDLLVN